MAPISNPQSHKVRSTHYWEIPVQDAPKPADRQPQTKHLASLNPQASSFQRVSPICVGNRISRATLEFTRVSSFWGRTASISKESENLIFRAVEDTDLIRQAARGSV